MRTSITCLLLSLWEKSLFPSHKRSLVFFALLLDKRHLIKMSRGDFQTENSTGRNKPGSDGDEGFWLFITKRWLDLSRSRNEFASIFDWNQQKSFLGISGTSCSSLVLPSSAKWLPPWFDDDGGYFPFHSLTNNSLREYDPMIESLLITSKRWIARPKMSPLGRSRGVDLVPFVHKV